MVKIIGANILSAFSASTIGTKVLDVDTFIAAVDQAIGKYDTSKDRVVGQHFIVLGPETFGQVSAGVGQRTVNPDDYVIRANRGQVNLYLKREKAAAVESLAVIVYTTEAYLTDPDVQGDSQEISRISNSGASHVLVAVLASAGPKAPLTPTRFLKNLAGGNREALVWSADEIRAKAKEVGDYDSQWCVVAD